MHTHNSIVVAWPNCLSELNLPHKLYIEPQYRYVNSEKRSDILVFDPDSGADIELDVSLLHAWCLIPVKAVSREGVAAVKQKEKKEAKYNSSVFKHIGRWCEQAV